MSATAIEQLRQVIRTCPVIDNHAHNLLRQPQLKTADLLSISSEAEGEALRDHVTALPHLRAARQLKELYCLPEEADWDTILKTRRELLAADSKELIRRCLQGTHTILIDDGLDGTFEKYSWHDQFVAAPCKRIVRIEAVAADILSALHQQAKLPVGTGTTDEEACSMAWVAFITAFEEVVSAYIADDEVAGFKSVICYRTGLDVNVQRDIDVTEAGLHSFRRYYLPHCTRSGFRVETKGMNDALVISACKLIEASYKNNGIAKPFQFHTGLGDNDISLLESNPACMQPLISRFPNAPFVLLHSSYPYTREAGYLATVYKNVFLDIGEVFPMVSREGQEQIVRQALEITPTSKILWSTDGHHHPETYWLASLQGREALERVFCDYVEKKDLTVSQATRAVRDIFFENSNSLYDLGLHLPTDQELPERSIVTPATNLLLPAISAAPDPISLDVLPSRFAAILTDTSTTHEDMETFIFVQWVDHMALIRSRWLPITEYKRLMQAGPARIAITRGVLGITQTDHMSTVCNPVGSMYVEPDLASLRPMYPTGPVKNTYTIMSRFVDEHGIGLSVCPRAKLQSFVESCKQQFDINFLVGFEIETVFCSRQRDGFSPLDTVHAWGTITDQQYTTAVGLMTSIATELQRIGIPIQQLHSEAAAGQYEFVLPPLPPLLAVDTLVQAKQCIQQMAATHGLRATCHPMPFPGVGTAAHAHMSLNSDKLPPSELEQQEISFMAAVLAHLPAISAITMPQPASYGRVIDDSWSGGTWVAWGSNNRETPLRRVCSGRWEFRSLDGTANMYLALATILGVGLSGIQENIELKIRDCTINPSKLSDGERKDLGIVQRMPRSLEESLEAMKSDKKLWSAVGEDLILNWIGVKTAEQEELGVMGEEERKVWLMERY